MYVYKYSITRFCWCVKERYKYRGFQIEQPIDIRQAEQRNLVEIQHFYDDELDKWFSQTRIICRSCDRYINYINK